MPYNVCLSKYNTSITWDYPGISISARLGRYKVPMRLRGIGGMKLDLVDGRDDFARRVVEEPLQVTNLKVGHADVPDFPRVQQLLHFLPWLISLTAIPWIYFGTTHQVFTKSQSGRCFDGPFGSVEQGKCTKYKSIYSRFKSLRDLSNPSLTLWCQGLSSLVVTQIWSRGIPESRIPWPTSTSFR